MSISIEPDAAGIGIPVPASLSGTGALEWVLLLRYPRGSSIFVQSGTGLTGSRQSGIPAFRPLKKNFVEGGQRYTLHFHTAGGVD